MKTKPWIYQVYEGNETLAQYYMAYQDAVDKHEGQYSVRVEKREGATKRLILNFRITRLSTDRRIRFHSGIKRRI